jgi:hypothetical protein
MAGEQSLNLGEIRERQQQWRRFQEKMQGGNRERDEGEPCC